MYAGLAVGSLNSILLGGWEGTRCSLGPQGSKARHKLDSGPLKKGAQLSSGVTSSYLGSDKIRLQC